MDDGRDHIAVFRADVENSHHERDVVVSLKPFDRGFAQNRQGKRPERFAPFNFRIQNVFDSGVARIPQNGTILQRARPPLHSPVKPTDNFSVRNSLRRLLRKFFFVADVGDRAVRVRDLFFLPIVEGRKGKMSILRTILSPHKMCRNDCHSLGHCRFEESPYSLSSRRFRLGYGGN